MNFRYGFELEGFYLANGIPAVPPKTYPVDGFPGLVELRTTGGYSLDRAWSEIIRMMLSYTDDVDFRMTQWKFSGSDMAQMRRDCDFHKDRFEILNIYGKAPRRLGNLTFASLQINISNLVTDEYFDSERRKMPARYGLLDAHGIVKRLDKEFSKEIKDSNRQPGMYAIKDEIRLEYRSLPNCVFEREPHQANVMLERIRAAVENKEMK